MKVCMFVLNNCTRDSRVLKEAQTLAQNGHEVTIIALLDDTSSPRERRDGFQIVRVELGYLFQNARQVIDKVDQGLAAHTTRLHRLYRAFRRLVNLVARPLAITGLAGRHGA